MSKSAAALEPRSNAMAYETIMLEKKDGVAIITLNRPAALNALNNQLIEELGQALDEAEGDQTIGAIVLTGNEKAFAAGADIKEMQNKSFADCYTEDFIKPWERLSQCRKPTIAAVAGFALGGGCETAMMCDIIIAADTAKFGQPEITLGVIPGAGGTQRLARAVGKAKAMEMCLTGRMMDAAEAEKSGLAAKVVPAADLMAETMKMAAKIASMPRLASMTVKECINQAFEGGLSQGVRLERRLFHALFATNDQKEGMSAFAEKRKPAFKNK